MAQIKLQLTDVNVGKALPWGVYNIEGILLLEKGYVVKSEHQLEILLSSGIYRDTKKEAELEGQQIQVEEIIHEPDLNYKSPFEFIEECSIKLGDVFVKIENKDTNAVESVLQLAQEIQVLCDNDLDAALGAVHLIHHIKYTLIHPIHTACLSDMIAQYLDYNVEHRQLLIAANLTANIGMRKLQKRLYRQIKPPTDEQRKEIRAHPARSVALLKQAGVDNELWLKIILQHHEHNDGSGYNGLKGEEIVEEARIIALTDCYTAMVSPRETRGALSSPTRIANLFLVKGKQFDSELAIIFIHSLGLFPPGCIVQLANDDIAVVVERPMVGLHPSVKSIMTSRGTIHRVPKYLNCNIKEHAIKRLYTATKPPFHILNHLWDKTSDKKEV